MPVILSWDRAVRLPGNNVEAVPVLPSATTSTVEFVLLDLQDIEPIQQRVDILSREKWQHIAGKNEICRWDVKRCQISLLGAQLICWVPSDVFVEEGDSGCFAVHSDD